MGRILKELRSHAPFTAFGAATGVALVVIIIVVGLFQRLFDVSHYIFYVLHPAHVVLSSIATTAMYVRYRPQANIIWKILVGYIGSIGIATLSDSIIPYFGEWLLDLPNRGVHIGFIEEPLVVNVAALLGIVIAFWKPSTKLPHSGHVLLSTWASLFHIMMALGESIQWILVVPIFAFLFLAVWVPCCTSDIAFPLLFIPRKSSA
jgi:hypothetical protein